MLANLLFWALVGYLIWLTIWDRLTLFKFATIAAIAGWLITVMQAVH